MKYRIFILPLLLGSVSASAYELDVYYDLNGNYDTFCTFPYVGPGDCPSPITGQEIAEKFMSLAESSDEVFSGFTLPDSNGTVLMDSTGNLKLTGKQVNDMGLDSTVTLRTSNTCASSRNSNGVCVYGLDTATQDYTYVDFANGDIENGYEMLPDDLVGGTKGESCMHSEFNVRIHWCPPKYGAYTGNWGNGATGWNPPNSPSGFDYPELWPSDCENGDTLYTDLHYKWVKRSNSSTTCGDSSGCPGTKDSNGVCRCAAYTQNNQIIDSLNVPSGKFTDWTLRGFYLGASNLWEPPSGCTSGTNQSYNDNCYNYWGNRNYFAKWRVTTKNNTDGMARLGLPKNSTETGFIPLNDRDLNNWANTRWGVWDCSKTDEQVANTTYHLYAGWARKCDPGEDGTCTLTIKRTGLHELNDKGDAFYQSGCKDGSLPQGNSGSSYKPICTTVPKTISYTYDKYRTTSGVNVTSCTGKPSADTCSPGTNLTLADPTSLNCGGNYVFYKWNTSGGMHDAGDSISCSYEELGSYTDANITGILCDCDNPSGSATDRCNAVCGGNDGDGDAGGESQEGA
ncbi:MAG: hypothetical protein J6S80_00950 [Alphaproteobacteria bacterium]|nr:hypothetical protein [Alphaproteobacteria bacterium]